MTQPRLLIVEDALDVAEMLQFYFSSHGYDVLVANDGETALKLCRAQLPSLVLLDIGLPDIDGREVCRLLRRARVRIPIIMLTAAEGEANEILGLDSGANDYVPKPFRLNVLLARVRAQLRQHEQSEDAVFAIGGYSFRPAQKLLVAGEGKTKVRLTEKEVAILKYLYRAGGRAVSREVLLNEVWGYNAGVATHTLETHIYRLRQKIEADPANAAILITEAGGYSLRP